MRVHPRVSLALLALVVAVIPAAEARAAVGEPKREPNVLLIITDDQRDRTMGVMPRTLEIFRDGGTRYPKAFVTTPQCCPSRSSIYTGKFIHSHGVRSNHEASRFGTDDFIFRYLHERGYRTAIFGKFLNGWGNGEVPFVDVRQSGAGDRLPGRYDRVIGEQAGDFIEAAEEDDRRWAVALSMRTPHGPLEPEPRYAKRPMPRCRGYSNPGTRERDFSDKNPRLARAQHHVRAGWICRAQLRMQITADDVIDELWGRIEALGAGGSETLATFVSDNGYYWGEHRLKGKFLPYLESLAVPMYARWPGRLPSGEADRRFALNIDIAPTIYDAVGIVPDREPDGRSLLDPTWDREWVMFEGASVSNHQRWPRWTRAYYDGRRHYFEWRNGFREYYNLRRDPRERENLLASDLRRKRRRARMLARPLARQLELARDCRGPAECP